VLGHPDATLYARVDNLAAAMCDPSMDAHDNPDRSTHVTGAAPQRVMVRLRRRAPSECQSGSHDKRDSCAAHHADRGPQG
jgi:hypothetical protein